MKSWKKASVLGVACMLALGGLTACGDDDGGTPDGAVDSSVDGTVDSDTPDADPPDGDMDSDVPDGGMTDGDVADADGGDPPPTVAFVRVAHLLANAPPGSTAATGGWGAIRVCVQVDLTGAFIGPLPSKAGGDVGLPHRGVSPYLEFPTGLDYTVQLYAADDIDALDPEHCPVEADGVAPILSASIGATEIEAGKFYTAGAIGLLADAGGAMPSMCGATFSEVCPDAFAARIGLTEDDGVLEAGMIKVRWNQGIANFPMVDLCFDDDPSDATPATTLFSNVAPLSSTDYITVAAMTSGLISVHAHVDGMECVGGDATLAQIPVPLPADLAAMLPDGTLADYPADHVVTIFSSGRISPAPPDPDALAPLFLTWIDQPVPM